MNDLISRQAAIDYFVTNVGVVDENGYAVDDYDKRVEVWTERFSGIPSADPEERTAKVIERDASIMDDRGYKYLRTEYLCGNCKKKVIGGDEYCSHCGCRLEEWE